MTIPPSSSRHSQQNTRTLRLTIVGDSAVGKSSMIAAYSEGQFLSNHTPTVFENCLVSALYSPNRKSVKGKRGSKRNSAECAAVCLSLMDSAGDESRAGLRVLCYPGSDVFLVCFSVTDRVSFQNVEKKWIPEIKKFGGADCKFILVGLKSDLREDPQTLHDLKQIDMTPVTTEEMEAYARRYDCPSCEISAKDARNIQEAFYLAMDSVLRKEFEGKEPKRKPVCCIQ